MFSTWAHAALVPGATVLAAPPDGRFGSAPDTVAPAHYLGVAAGSGITPILAIVGDVLATQARSRVTLVYGNRASSSVMFREELLALKDRYLARLSLVFVMSREPQEIATFAGRIDRAKCDALFARWVDIASVDRAYVCGPAEMMAQVAESLAVYGLTGDRVRIERFAATKSEVSDSRRAAHGDATVSDDEICDARATIDGRTFVFPIRRGTETVLDAGLRAGIELPYSCKGGVCATCRAVLTDGEVDMDVHYALEDYEITRGFVLLCQSYPASATIAVDLDANATA
jgi:ring-1,2-phenylacetyl-CoA epoxidase subunit PaaE